MQKLFKNCYKMDAKCYSKYNLSEDLLMEHAASKIESFIRKKFKKGSKVLIVSGAGNNGADGVVAARLLHKDYKIKLYLPFGAKSDMAKLQLDRVKLLGVKIVKDIKRADVVVDALFGAGLNRELNSDASKIINRLNSMQAFKIACDIPSGISEKGVPLPIAFRADVTITMGALKEALYSDLAKDYVGKVKVANLGVSRELYEDSSDTFLLEISDFCKPIKRAKNSHKGDFGHVGVFVGQKEGAGIISAMAATRFGAGLTTLVYHEKITHPPYLMSSSSLPKNCTAVAIGMGLGDFFEDEFLQQSIIESNLPTVLDADALYKESLLKIIEQKREVVITPHPKEFAAILEILKIGKLEVADIQKDRFNLARAFSKQYPNVVLLLKGANPIVAKDGKLYINPLGNQVLAKGGSGDILSGLIAAELARGNSALQSAINGSLALALASKKYKKANYFATSTDIIKELAKL
jgi:hydroxyethylthiazole kinase-like uncharacterized protein yjeF